MTRNDLEVIARGINETLAMCDNTTERRTLYGLATNMAMLLNTHMGYTNLGNRKFDRRKFMVACGFPNGLPD